jgi:hypothetical protein
VNPHYPRVAERAGHRCEYCRAPEAIFNFPFEVEHINPLRRGGTNDDSNLALACRSCNLLKSDAVSATDQESGIDATLFHPRQDDWDEHFTIDDDGLTIRGVSPTGRATVDRLQLNSAAAVAARRQWRRLGLYPPSTDIS